MISRRTLLGMTFASLLSTTAFAQNSDWPNKSIKVIVPYPTGGVSDGIIRIVAERLSTKLGQSIIVENKPGAGGTLGMDLVAKAAPDGYTFGFAAISPLTLNPHVMNVPYDALKDFIPVASVMYSPIYLLASPKFTGKSFEDVIAMSKAKPGSVTIATSGYGTVGHIMVEQMRKKSGTDLTHVPYKGGGQVATDALGGHFDLMLANPYANLNSLIEQGKLRPLAVGAPVRLTNLPEVRTFAELNYPEVNLTSLFGFFAPAKTPNAIIQKLNASVNEVLKEDSIQDRVRKAENLVMPSTPDEFAAKVRNEFTSNQKIVKEANIKAE